MAKTKSKARRAADSQSWDGIFLLKMILYLIIGSLWVKLSNGTSLQVALPVGLLVGLVFAMHEHFQLDRKLEYIVLLIAMLIGYIAPFGLYVNF